jgi:hypothetical protein
MPDPSATARAGLPYFGTETAPARKDGFARLIAVDSRVLVLLLADAAAKFRYRKFGLSRKRASQLAGATFAVPLKSRTMQLLVAGHRRAVAGRVSQVCAGVQQRYFVGCEVGYDAIWETPGERHGNPGAEKIRFAA